MKLKNSITLVILIVNVFSVYAQTIHIHSIATERQLGGDNGYTLDGDYMTVTRAKLLNPANFSDTGIYKKKIEIYSGYSTSGSLEHITQEDSIDIFFFGSFFGVTSQDFTPFTQAEIDSLYEWSVRGGKMIIAEQCCMDGTQLVHLGGKWGYQIVQLVPASIYPTAKAKSSKIFNGPFGVVDHASEGGSAEGYFRGIGPEKKILGTISSQSNLGSLMFDCKTRDLILSDVDVFTNLGGLSVSPDIINDQDRFLGNVIAFMDSLDNKPPHAVISYDGTNLHANNYSGYQWMKGWDTLSGLDTSSIVPPADGYYRVIVQDEYGCTDTSAVYVVGTPLKPAVGCQEDTVTHTDLHKNYATLSLPSPKVIDNYGIASITNDAPDSFPMGTTTVTWTVTNNKGYSSTCSNSVTVLDTELPEITCPSDINTGTEPGLNYDTVSLGTPIATDNVGVISVTNNARDRYPIGTTIVQWTATDAAGNKKTCSQRVNVKDMESPVIVCPSDTVITANLKAGIIAFKPHQPTVSDNDTVASVTNDAPTVYPAGTTSVTWTAADRSGNVATCVQNITITQADENNLSIPNIITPNGDGKNEYFIIDNLPDNCELVIFDRSDKIIYKTSNYQNDWAGMDTQLNYVENGSYWYVLTLPSGKKYTGYVVVKR